MLNLSELSYFFDGIGLDSKELSFQIKTVLEGEVIEKADEIKALKKMKSKPKQFNPPAQVESENLFKYAINFTDLASQGKFDKVVCRDESLNGLIEILCRRTKNNPIILGEAGVGKTAIVEGLAQKIVSGNVSSGDVFYNDFSYQLPDPAVDSTYNIDNLSLITYLCERNSFEIIQVIKTSLTP